MASDCIQKKSAIRWGPGSSKQPFCQSPFLLISDLPYTITFTSLLVNDMPEEQATYILLVQAVSLDDKYGRRK